MSAPFAPFWQGKTIALVSFSPRGETLAHRLASATDGAAVRGYENADFSLHRWTEEAFATADALIFIGAAGIAIRAIAPFVQSKAVDPAVVAVDEGGRFAIPLLSGHLGGANDLARSIAGLIGATAVITTATDVNGVFAVDEWARVQGCAVENPGDIKGVSAKALAGEDIRIFSQWPVAGAPPKGVRLCDEAPWDVSLTLRGDGPGLRLVPRILTLGVGCRRDTPQDAIEAAFCQLLAETKLPMQAFCAVASIDLKKEEPGLLAFCADHGWTLQTFSADRLEQTAGDFTASDFVRAVTGVDNICERSAVAACGGRILVKKRAEGGVTMAVAQGAFAPDWRWQYG